MTLHLVKFEAEDGEVWINPEAVASLIPSMMPLKEDQPHPDPAVLINLVGGVGYVVKGGIYDIVRTLIPQDPGRRRYWGKY